MATRYFVICEDIGDTEPAFEYQKKYGKRYISHAQKGYAYIPENFREEYGYPTLERCQQEIRKRRRAMERIHLYGSFKYIYTCEMHDVPDTGAGAPG